MFCSAWFSTEESRAYGLGDPAKERSAATGKLQTRATGSLPVREEVLLEDSKSEDSSVLEGRDSEEPPKKLKLKGYLLNKIRQDEINADINFKASIPAR